MYLKSSKLLLCLAMLMMSVLVGMHSGAQASGLPNAHNSELSNIVIAEQVSHETNVLDLNTAGDEHCVQHSVFVLPSDIAEAVLVALPFKAITSSSFLVSENCTQLLRPPNSRVKA